MAYKSQVAQLLDLVIEQKLELDQYKRELPTLIHYNFVIQCKAGCHTGNQACAEHVVDEIISWENGNQSDSLEATLIKKFHITGNCRYG